jgi:hypothetical protein
VADVTSKSDNTALTEFLIHARTVHLTIITTTFLLLVTMLGLPASDLKIAQRDLQRFKTALNSGEIGKLVDRSFLLAGRGDGRWKSKGSGTYTWELDFRDGERKVTVLTRLYSRGSGYILPLEEQLIPRVSPGEKDENAACETLVRPDTLNFEFETKIPDKPSLSDARRLWNCLAKLQVGQILDVGYANTKPVPLSGRLAEMSPNNFVAIRPLKATTDEFLDTLASVSFPALTFAEYQRSAFLEFSPGVADTDDDPSGAGFFAHTPRRFFRGDASALPEQVYTAEVRVPLSMRYLNLKTQQLLIKEFFPDVEPGDFDRRFRALAEWSATRADRPIDVLLEDISAELQRSSDTLELFGAKVPVRALAIVGAGLVSLLQVYLALHLNHLRMTFTGQTLPPTPWLGTMAGASAKAMTFSTLTIIPTLVVMTLLARGHAATGWLVTGAALLACFAASTLLACGLIGYWRVFLVTKVTASPQSDEAARPEQTTGPVGRKATSKRART